MTSQAHPFRVSLLVITAILRMCSDAVYAQEVFRLQGIVRDSVTTAGVPYANVCSDTREGAVTDENGLFYINLQPGSSLLHAFAEGYTPKTVSVSDAKYGLIDISLSPTPELIHHNQASSRISNLCSVFFKNYISTGHPSKFDIGPINTFASYNGLEGLRLRAGGTTTANLSKRWFASGYLARGFRDHKWKYGVEAQYSFIDKSYHSHEFPIHAIRLIQSYDVDRLGAHYLFTNPDNFVLSLQRLSNDRYTYKRLARLEYILELNCNFSITASLENVRQIASRGVHFVTVNGQSFGHYTENIGGIQLRYAPGEKFINTNNSRQSATDYAPVFVLSHRIAPKGFGGSRFGVCSTEFSFTKCFNLSILGKLTSMLAAGHVWSQAAFPELLIPNANLSYTIQPFSFALMNPMEFINTSYFHWDFTYEAPGTLFSRVQLIGLWNMRPLVGFRGLLGHLDQRCRPGPSNPELFLFPEGTAIVNMNRKPYMEIAVGLDNILRVIRLDYVWRLSYTDVPYEIDRRGVRVALNFTF